MLLLNSYVPLGHLGQAGQRAVNLVEVEEPNAYACAKTDIREKPVATMARRENYLNATLM